MVLALLPGGFGAAYLFLGMCHRWTCPRTGKIKSEVVGVMYFDMNKTIPILGDLLSGGCEDGSNDAASSPFPSTTDTQRRG